MNMLKAVPWLLWSDFFRYRMKNKIHRPRGPSFSNEPQYVVFVFPKQTSAPQVLACQFTMQGRGAGNHSYFFSFPLNNNHDVSFGWRFSFLRSAMTSCGTYEFRSPVRPIQKSISLDTIQHYCYCKKFLCNVIREPVKNVLAEFVR